MSPDVSDNFKCGLALAEAPARAYAEDTGVDSLIARAVARVAAELGCSVAEKGPFGALIQPGARVLLKPNWVLHHNQGPGGMEPMITHHSVIKAVVHAVLQADPAEVIVGHTQIQTCDFEQLLAEGDLATWAS